MIDTWHKARDWFLDATKDQQVRYLSSLLYHVSMLARVTYESGTENLDAPIDLRRFNELIQRIAAHQLDIIEEYPCRMSDEVFFEYLAEATMEVSISAEMLLQRLFRQSGQP